MVQRPNLQHLMTDTGRGCPFQVGRRSQQRWCVHIEVLLIVCQVLFIVGVTAECTRVQPYQIAQAKHADAWTVKKNPVWTLLNEQDKATDIGTVVLRNLAHAVHEVTDVLVLRSSYDAAVMDVGANVGNESLLFSDIFEGHLVHAFEAQQRVFGTLRQRLAAHNATGQFQVHFQAAFNVAGQNLTMYAPKVDNWSTTGSGHAGRLRSKDMAINTVTTTRLDSWCAARHTAPVFAKIDTAGSELFVLESMNGLLEKGRIAAFTFEYMGFFSRARHIHAWMHAVSFKANDGSFQDTRVE